MNNPSGISKSAGRAGSLVAVIGVAAFFIGIFGGPRLLAFVGVALIAAALAAFFVEERGHRKAAYRNQSSNA
ncbi:MAG: hypothetical protein WKF34_09945 [Pyrinomonadaceae bacterium]